MSFQKIKSVIVEDELAAREVLKNYFTSFHVKTNATKHTTNIPLE